MFVLTERGAEGCAVDEVADRGGCGYGWVTHCFPDEVEFGPKGAIEVVPYGGMMQCPGGVRLIEGREPSRLQRGEGAGLLDVLQCKPKALAGGNEVGAVDS